MITMIRVTVQFQPETKSLTIDPPQITITEQNWVRWVFLGLPSDHSPQIVFDDVEPLGPFASLREQSRPEPPTPFSEIFGKGNVGPASGASYTYNALVLDPSGMTVAQSAGGLTNNATTANSSPVVTVTFGLPLPAPAPSLPGSLVAAPLQLLLNPGDTAAWVFLNPPPGSHAVLWFQMPQGRTLRGPFSSTTLSPFQDGFILSAMNFQPPPLLADPGWSLSYSIELWNATDKLAAFEDPSIENLGPPPGGPMGWERLAE
jgi:hypothetical protein